MVKLISILIYVLFGFIATTMILKIVLTLRQKLLDKKNKEKDSEGDADA